MDKVMIKLIGGTHDGKTIALSHKDQVLVYMPSPLLAISDGYGRMRNPDELYNRNSVGEYVYWFTIHYGISGAPATT